VNGQARWHVGGLTITKIDEMVAPTTLSWLIPAAAAPLPGWIDPRHLGPAAGQIPLSYAGFVIETDTERALVDTGIGPEHSRGPGAGSLFVTNLRRAGHPPESIDTVICNAPRPVCAHRGACMKIDVHGHVSAPESLRI
jgi:hypothetical protein